MDPVDPMAKLAQVERLVALAAAVLPPRHLVGSPPLLELLHAPRGPTDERRQGAPGSSAGGEEAGALKELTGLLASLGKVAWALGRDMDAAAAEAEAEMQGSASSAGGTAGGGVGGGSGSGPLDRVAGVVEVYDRMLGVAKELGKALRTTPGAGAAAAPGTGAGGGTGGGAAAAAAAAADAVAAVRGGAAFWMGALVRSGASRLRLVLAARERMAHINANSWNFSRGRQQQQQSESPWGLAALSRNARLWGLAQYLQTVCTCVGWLGSPLSRWLAAPRELLGCRPEGLLEVACRAVEQEARQVAEGAAAGAGGASAWGEGGAGDSGAVASSTAVVGMRLSLEAVMRGLLALAVHPGVGEDVRGRLRQQGAGGAGLAAGAGEEAGGGLGAAVEGLLRTLREGAPAEFAGREVAVLEGLVGAAAATGAGGSEAAEAFGERAKALRAEYLRAGGEEAGGAGEAAGDAGEGQGLVMPRVCGNPGCANLGGACEADLGLSQCGGCRAVRYCGQRCQREHWRAGHRTLCTRA